MQKQSVLGLFFQHVCKQSKMHFCAMLCFARNIIVWEASNFLHFCNVTQLEDHFLEIFLKNQVKCFLRPYGLQSRPTRCLKITQNVAFEFWYFSPIFVLLKLTCMVTLFDRKLQIPKNAPKWTIFGISNWLSSTQNVNVAHFARNVEWGFFCDFQTTWSRPTLLL
mgnify:CR=1 FL=1